MSCRIVKVDYKKSSNNLVGVHFWYALGQDHGLFISGDEHYSVKKGFKKSDLLLNGVMFSFDATEFPPILSENNRYCVPRDAALTLKTRRLDSYKQLVVQDCCSNGISDESIAGDGTHYPIKIVMLRREGNLMQGVDYDAIIKVGSDGGSKYDNWIFAKKQRKSGGDYFLAAIKEPSSIFDRDEIPATLRFGDGKTEPVRFNTDYHMYVKDRDIKRNYFGLKSLSANDSNHSIGVGGSSALRVRVTSYEGGTPCGDAKELPIEKEKQYATFPETELDVEFGPLLCCAVAAEGYWQQQQQQSRAQSVSDNSRRYIICATLLLLLLVITIIAFNKK